MSDLCIWRTDTLCGVEEEECANPQRPPGASEFREAKEEPSKRHASPQAQHDHEAEDTDGEEISAIHSKEAKFHKDSISDSVSRDESFSLSAHGDVSVEPPLESQLSGRFITSSQAPDSPNVHREPVFVQVYDLGHTPFTRGFNKVNKAYGAFHTAVEVYGIEWSFGMTFDDWSSGVASCLPTEDPDHRYKEALLVGHTTLSQRDVFLLLDRLRSEWLGCKYNLLTCNCHHFTDCLIQELGCGPMPKHLNNLATEGAKLNDGLEHNDHGWDGGDAVMEMFSGAKSAFTNLFRSHSTDSDDRDQASASASMPSATASSRRSY